MSKEDIFNEELQDWIEALENTLLSEGKEYSIQLLSALLEEVRARGLDINRLQNWPFKNTVLNDEEISYPGNWEYEEKIRHIIRWNSLLMVLKANQNDDLGGHISTYSSAATLYEVGFNHFFRGSDNQLGDLIYFQGHSSPGIYARSFLEGRITEEQIKNFRKEIDGKGLSSYPHPWLMPDYWQFPTVSMGLGPIFGIYQAHIMRYLEKRGLIQNDENRKVWVYCGDGEMDEPESLGAIGLAARENLNNLVFVINCNLQRLDGPVRGNSKIITELAKQFDGAGWNVVNLIWGRHWDDLINKDNKGLLQKIMDETVDGEYQNFKAKGGKYTRENFFAKNPKVLEMVKSMSDDEVERLNRGGHDPLKVYNAYRLAYENKVKPTVILAFTIKGYGIGSRQADNTTHQVKKLTQENIEGFVEKFDLPIDKNKLDNPNFLDLESHQDLKSYLHERRKALGGFIPLRKVSNEKLNTDNQTFSDFNGPLDREQSTTMVFVKILTKLLRDKNIGERIVPIVPDEARTFGMDALFRQFGIYSSEGQKYEPEDADKVMFYRESESGIMLEEGINEAGAFSAWLALATSYANNQLPMIPFYIFYSMFGFQRIHDLAWAAGDSRAKGFLLGATSGRTTLNGEGLQHQDGHSHIFASTIPNCRSYDPAFSYEISSIIENGIEDMYVKGNDRFYYLTLMNENYQHPKRPKDATTENIMKGAYQFLTNPKANIRLLASGATLNFAIEAERELKKYNVIAEIWSITSFNELYKDAIEIDRNNRLEIKKSISYVEKCFSKEMPTIAVSEYIRAHPNQIREWVNGEYIVLGTDGFGRSDTRSKLRDYFEISKNHIVLNALNSLKMKKESKKYVEANNIKLDKKAPWLK
ncbi:MAG: pyruvate dehydrogenase (acetyl-transferring), homodimeric type [Gammaproteobacteria bacterium]|uniref:Pyruvate dehydrogenase E1 component n=1 Tax=SAR86 cluster bacterium TaxID=2030880 RepID=A0A520MZD9_9GAMM|nr:pyruvate dehydrogenase (acetyl-transferring), homodimeric type [SAR86 cluster bacterium]RZO26584.1 MAG: pyruvate dehydrogenase (acetyl-transferring), homodimeric type [SAR86 cluster bacterium]